MNLFLQRVLMAIKRSTKLLTMLLQFVQYFFLNVPSKFSFGFFSKDSTNSSSKNLSEGFYQRLLWKFSQEFRLFFSENYSTRKSESFSVSLFLRNSLRNFNRNSWNNTYQLFLDFLRKFIRNSFGYFLWN